MEIEEIRNSLNLKDVERLENPIGELVLGSFINPKIEFVGDKFLHQIKNFEDL